MKAEMYELNKLLLFSIPIRSGAWNDIMNSCFYDEVFRVSDEYVVCRDKATDELFALRYLKNK